MHIAFFSFLRISLHCSVAFCVCCVVSFGCSKWLQLLVEKSSRVRAGCVSPSLGPLCHFAMTTTSRSRLARLASNGTIRRDGNTASSSCRNEIALRFLPLFDLRRPARGESPWCGVRFGEGIFYAFFINLLGNKIVSFTRQRLLPVPVRALPRPLFEAGTTGVSLHRNADLPNALMDAVSGCWFTSVSVHSFYEHAFVFFFSAGFSSLHLPRHYPLFPLQSFWNHCSGGLFALVTSRHRLGGEFHAFSSRVWLQFILFLYFASSFLFCFVR